MVEARGLIQDEVVRHFALTGMLLLSGCAAAPHEEVVTAHSEVIAVDAAPPEVAPPPAPRPRLSRTLTLGQGSESVAYSPAQPPPVPPAAAAPAVVVNNILVPGTPVYGGGGYYGYRGGGYPGGYGLPRGEARPGAPTSGAWAPSGWEGAGRTAAPGQTPGVGGNWAPVPSYGPRAMR